MCGTPVIAQDTGAFLENVENGKTGLLCHTLQDYCTSIQLALDGYFDREYIRKTAVSKYDMYKVAKQYDYVFKNICELYNGNQGWYSHNSYLHLKHPDILQKIKTKKITKEILNHDSPIKIEESKPIIKHSKTIPTGIFN